MSTCNGEFVGFRRTDFCNTIIEAFEAELRGVSDSRLTHGLAIPVGARKEWRCTRLAGV